MTGFAMKNKTKTTPGMATINREIRGLDVPHSPLQAYNVDICGASKALCNPSRELITTTLKRQDSLPTRHLKNFHMTTILGRLLRCQFSGQRWQQYQDVQVKYKERRRLAIDLSRAQRGMRVARRDSKWRFKTFWGRRMRLATAVLDMN